jgi:hypothetical protein
MATACYLSGMVNFRRTIPNQQKMKLKTLFVNIFHTEHVLLVKRVLIGCSYH